MSKESDFFLFMATGRHSTQRSEASGSELLGHLGGRLNRNLVAGKLASRLNSRVSFIIPSLSMYIFFSLFVYTSSGVIRGDDEEICRLGFGKTPQLRRPIQRHEARHLPGPLPAPHQ